MKVIESISNNSDVEYSEGILETMTDAVNEVIVNNERNGSTKTPKSGPRVNIIFFYCNNPSIKVIQKLQLNALKIRIRSAFFPWKRWFL